MPVFILLLFVYVHIKQAFWFKREVSFRNITAAVIALVLWKGCAVCLHLRGQGERNPKTMIMVWLIRRWSTAEYLKLIKVNPAESHVAN